MSEENTLVWSQECFFFSKQRSLSEQKENSGKEENSSEDNKKNEEKPSKDNTKLSEDKKSTIDNKLENNNKVSEEKTSNNISKGKEVLTADDLNTKGFLITMVIFWISLSIIIHFNRKREKKEGKKKDKE